MPPGAWVRIPDGVSVRVLDDEAVVLHAGTGRYYGFDRSAVTFWEVLRSEPSRQAAVTTLARHFDAPASTLGADLDRFCDELEERGLITRHGS